MHAFPHERRFVEDVTRIALAIAPTETAERELRENVTSALRPWYPRIVIHRREDLAAVATGDVVWYAYRDGSVHRTLPHLDRLHAVLADARETAAGADAAMRHAAEMLELARLPRSRRQRQDPLAAAGPAGASTAIEHDAL